MNRIAAGLCLCAAIVAAPAFGQREAFRRNPPPAEPLTVLLPSSSCILLSRSWNYCACFINMFISIQRPSISHKE